MAVVIKVHSTSVDHVRMGVDHSGVAEVVVEPTRLLEVVAGRVHSLEDVAKGRGQEFHDEELQTMLLSVYSKDLLRVCSFICIFKYLD